MDNHKHLSGIRQNPKNSVISYNILNDIFIFLCMHGVRYAWCEVLYADNVHSSVYDFDTILVFYIM